MRIRRTKGGRSDRKIRSPGISTFSPNGYVTRSTVCPSSRSARMRWYSLNGVPRGSKNGSGAIIRIRMNGRVDGRKALGIVAEGREDTRGRLTVSMSRDGRGKRARSATLVLLKLAVSIGLLVILLGRADLAHIADALGHADPWWIVAGLAIYAAILALSAWRWDMLLAAQDVRVPFPR